jgi:bifunctional UDP-N-acetylglucosamine pyrophosphorylase/glucosamine-1-phosphate N-acetyltransferase
MQSITGALVLAAGKGTRMHSDTPKVLARLLGEPMLWYVYQALAPVFGDHIWTVVGHGADRVRAAFPERADRFVLQAEQLGTGHALQVAWQSLRDAGVTRLVVINGDTPLAPTAALRAFVDQSGGCALSFMTLSLRDPAAFGRVVRKNGVVQAIVEAKDFDLDDHGPATGEINAGVYCLDMAAVEPLLGGLTTDNKSGEFYITDLVGLAVERDMEVKGVHCGADPQLLGINSPAELADAEELLRARIVADLRASGVLVRAADSVRVGPRVRVAPGAELCGPCDVLGATRIDASACVGPHVWIADSEVGPDAQVRPFSHLEGARLGPNAWAGPFARLRPGAVLERDAHVGNFVEVKKSVLREGVKAGHLSYLGDADVGARTNVGAGTITCNYDGKNKHATVIGEDAFIGSNTALVAPVTVGRDALVGAGSVITHDVPDGALAVARGRQKNLERKRGS